MEAETLKQNEKHIAVFLNPCNVQFGIRIRLVLTVQKAHWLPSLQVNFETMISVTITITLILLPLSIFHDFKSDAFPTVCARQCRCSVCPMIGMQQLTKMKCNASSLKDIQVPQNTCSL